MEIFLWSLLNICCCENVGIKFGQLIALVRLFFNNILYFHMWINKLCLDTKQAALNLYIFTFIHIIFNVRFFILYVIMYLQKQGSFYMFIIWQFYLIHLQLELYLLFYWSEEYKLVLIVFMSSNRFHVLITLIHK